MSEYKRNHGKSKPKEKKLNEHYDYSFTKKIYKLSEDDPYFVIESLEKYLKDYTDDYTSMCAYASLLTTIGEFEKASKYLDELEPKVLDDKRLYKVENGKKIRRLIANIKFCRFRILSNAQDYQNAYDYLLENKEEFCQTDVLDMEFNYNLEFYFKTRLGYKYKRENQPSYMCGQIVEYSEEAFLEHIKKHIEGIDETDSRSLFFKDIDLNKLYDEMKKYLDTAEPLYRGFMDRTYYFKYDSCGMDEADVVDYIKLVTFGDNIGAITMCPTRYGENLPHIDLNYLKNEEKGSARKLSRIDKFNQKYGIK